MVSVNVPWGRTASGEIRIRDIRGAALIKNSDGNVRVGDVVRGTIVLATADGELEVGIHEGTAAWLDVSTGYGNVDNSLHDSEAPVESDKTVKVRARNANGDIVIRRAAEGAWS